jgi:rfaE bifunctional protein kinase chain/domain
MHFPVFILPAISYLYVDNYNPVKNQQLSSLLEKFENLRVLIVGDVMLDSYVWGKVSRISPEAPVPVVMQMSTENRLGGAANVALNVKSLGGVPVMCSVIGTDENGKLFRDLVKELGMPEDGLISSDQRLTTNKTRIIAGNQQLIRVDREVDSYIESPLENALWERIQALINQFPVSAIIFQDYDKGVITKNLIEKTIELGNRMNIPTLIDPKKKNFSFYRNATLFKPNYKELTEGMNLHFEKSDFASVHEAAKTLHEKSGFDIILVTLSEHGMLISKDGEYRVVPTHAREIADVSGAGDTVIAMASLCLAAGVDPYSMAWLSNRAAGLVCERIGVVPVEKEWLLDAEIE